MVVNPGGRGQAGEGKLAKRGYLTIPQVEAVAVEA